jgi:hypothetical protein
MKAIKIFGMLVFAVFLVDVLRTFVECEKDKGNNKEVNGV